VRLVQGSATDLRKAFDADDDAAVFDFGAVLARPSYRALFDHPTADRFTAGQSLAELPRHGLQAGDRWATRLGGDFLLGVAHRRRPVD
jgi:hypothetical protein